MSTTPTTAETFATVRAAVETWAEVLCVNSIGRNKVRDALALLECRMGALVRAVDAEVVQWSGDQSWCRRCRTRTTQVVSPRVPHRHAPDCVLADDSEELADALDLESRAHERMRQALVEATRELERLRQVELVARAVLRVTDTPTTFETTESRLLEMVGVLAVLRAVLQVEEVPTLLKEMLANLGTRSVLAPPEAFTAAHSLEPEMWGLPGGKGTPP